MRAYARVTLALDVVKKLKEGRWKGFHVIRAIKQQIDIYDEITAEKSRKTQVFCEGTPSDNNNTCFKAVEAMRAVFGIEDSLKVKITKNIPSGSGLAGSSTDAAATIILANDIWKLNIQKPVLAEIGRRIGMDVPFFFYGGTAEDEEVLGIPKPIKTSLRFTYVLVYPGFPILTKDAYKLLSVERCNRGPDNTTKMAEAFKADDFKAVLSLIHNDFESPVYRKHPRLREVKEALISLGCTATMTGSGSTVIGIAKDEAHAKEVKSKIRWKSEIAHTM